MQTKDPVNPTYYTEHPCGIETIHIVKHHNLCVGSAIQYLLRAGLKSESGYTDTQKQIEDLKKAIRYIEFEIDRIKNV